MVWKVPLAHKHALLFSTIFITTTTTNLYKAKYKDYDSTSTTSTVEWGCGRVFTLYMGLIWMMLVALLADGFGESIQHIQTGEKL
jgi:hypothetical protein